MKITIKKELVEEVEVQLPLYLRHKSSNDWQIMVLSEDELVSVANGNISKASIVGSYLGDKDFILSTKIEFNITFKNAVKKLTKTIDEKKLSKQN